MPSSASHSSSSPSAIRLNKVPEVTAVFWIIKILATTIGETGADTLASNINPVIAYAAIGVCFLALLVGQLRVGRYIPWLYWITVVLVSVVGTLITDALTDGLSISLYLTSAVFAVALVATFVAWFASEQTLSVHTIVTPVRERFYWAAILFTFALGTATGDLLAEKLQLGYGLSVLIFAGAIALIAACHYLLGLNAILAFWLAYILTRPLGASLGDFLSQAKADGGLGAGPLATSAAFLTVIVVLVAVLTFRTREPNAASV